MIPWTIQEFSRPEYRSGEPFPSPGDLPNPGIEPRSPALQADSSPAEPPWKPYCKALFTSYFRIGMGKKRHQHITEWQPYEQGIPLELREPRKEMVMIKMTMPREIPECLRAEFWGRQAGHFVLRLLDPRGSNPDFWPWSHCWEVLRVPRNRGGDIAYPSPIVPSPSGGSLLTAPRMRGPRRPKKKCGHLSPTPYH